MDKLFLTLVNRIPYMDCKCKNYFKKFENILSKGEITITNGTKFYSTWR